MVTGVSKIRGCDNVPFCVRVYNISAGVVYGIVLITVLWLCNILASYVFKICVNELGSFASLVFFNCRDKLLIGYIYSYI